MMKLELIGVCSGVIAGSLPSSHEISVCSWRKPSSSFATVRQSLVAENQHPSIHSILLGADLISAVDGISWLATGNFVCR